MSGHGRSVFVNSCIKKPLSPRSKHPNPSYLVPQCSLDRGPDDPQLQDNMNTIMRKKATSKCPLARGQAGHQPRTKCCSITQQLRKETDNFQSLVKFYDSIPDYDALNHLPNEEFYCRLNTLRKKQRELRFNCFNGYETRCGTKRQEKRPVVSVEPPTASEQNEDTVSLHSWSKSPPATTNGILNASTRKGSAKSVRIETSKDDNEESEGRASRRKFRAGTPFVSDCEESTKNASTCTTPVNSDFVERYDRYVKRNLRCKSASPIRDYSKITIPQPYKMTQREEEERTLQELLIASKNAFTSKETLSKIPSTIKANPIPITSRIPLFNTIMADQEYRNQLAKLNSEIELQAQMKPFHFSERLNRPTTRCLSRSLSSPALLTTGFDPELKPTTFKAKPCPKNLFSNYFYFKMWEDEYFRNLNKRLRSEELMKQSSLPPAMARREKMQRKSFPARVECVDLNERISSASKKSKRRRKSKRSARRKKSVEEKCSEYFATVGDVFEQQRQPKPTAKPLYPSSNSSCSTSIDVHQQSGTNPAPIYPVNRPNLAATLRTEWCRKKLREMELDDSVSVKKTPKFQWGVKRSQAFQNLNLDHTHEEELNLRLATRKAEQKLRQEEHAINMELMRQRVKAAPLLLEGPPQWGPRLGHVTHRCMIAASGKDSEPLFRKTDKSKGFKKGLMKKRESSSCGRVASHDHNQHRLSDKHRSSSGSKLSNYSVDSFGKSSSKFCDSEGLCKLEDELDSFTDDV